MPYKVTARQIEAVPRMAGLERYAHFVGRVADWQEVWGLRSADGWVAMGDDQGGKGIPFWPHPEYAMASAAGDRASCKAERVLLEGFLGRWLPGMARGGVMGVVFPTPGMKGVVAEPLRLKEDLLAEGEKYGDGSEDQGCRSALYRSTSCPVPFGLAVPLAKSSCRRSAAAVV